MSSSYPSSEIIHPSSDLEEDVLIKVNNVSKKFCRDFKKSLWYGLKDTAADILHPTHKSVDSKLRPSEFWANQNVSFEVKRGECLGLIGHNGAGKTTLLKMLNGLIKPDTGRISMRGRIGALIALGAGFNPILTGRENIYVNGSIIGLQKKEIDQKLDEIIEFSEIEDAIDAPVRTYSSGMQVRLGFSIATHMQPDILLVDEVLAVGDVGFRNKSLRRMKSFIQRGGAAIIVSHQVQIIHSICDRCIMLENGKVEADAPTDECVRLYLESASDSGVSANTTDSEKLSHSEDPENLNIKSIEVIPKTGESLYPEECATIRVHYYAAKDFDNLGCRLIISDHSGTTRIGTICSIKSRHKVKITSKDSFFDVVVPKLPLVPNKYFIACGLVDLDINFGVATRGTVVPVDSFKISRPPGWVTTSAGDQEDLVLLHANWPKS